MAGKTFVAIKCPACGSGEVEARDATHFECGHCGSKFTPSKPPAPPPPAPSPPRADGSAVPKVAAAISGCVIGVIVIALVLTIGIVVAVLVVVNNVTSDLKLPDIVVTAPPVTAPNGEPSGPSAASTPATAEPAVSPAEAGDQPSRPRRTPRHAGAAREATRTLRDPSEAGAVVEAFQPLQGCSCKADFDGDGKTETVELSAKGSTVGTTITSGGTFRTYGLEFLIRGPKAAALHMDPALTDAPPSRLEGDWLDLGVGCTDDSVMIAAGKRVTSWSLRDRKVSWTTELAAPYTKKPTARSNDGLVIDCGKLPVKNGKVDIRLPGGTAKLEVATGVANE